jgi:hypothetical protein
MTPADMGRALSYLEDQNDNSAKSDRVSRLAGSRYTVDRAGLIAAPHKKIILFQYGIAKLPLRTSGVTAKDVALTDEPPSSGDQIHLALVSLITTML